MNILFFLFLSNFLTPKVLFYNGPPPPQESEEMGFDIGHYNIDLDFVSIPNTLRGKIQIIFSSKKDTLKEVKLHARGMTILGNVYQEGIPTPSVYENGILLVELVLPVLKNDTSYIDIEFSKNYLLSDTGLYYVNSMFFTHNEPQDARHWFPCFDEPFDKATLQLSLLLPKGYDAVSNGIEVFKQESSNFVKYIFYESHPLSTYLVAFAAYPGYYRFSDFYQDIPILYYVLPEDSADAKYDLENTPFMMEFYSALLGKYPFGKYAVGEVFFPGGFGMENQTITLVDDSWFDGQKGVEHGFAHELAHHWFGDMVTLKDWKEIWLNEGFASYFEVIWMGDFYGQSKMRERMEIFKTNYFISDSLYGRFPIYNPVRMFDAGTVYKKGAWVLHMLRYVMGDMKFFNGIRNYIAENSLGNATIADFQSAMEKEYYSSLAWFFQEWIFDQGYPEIFYRYEIIPEGIFYDVKLLIKQVQENAPVFIMPFDVAIINLSGEDTIIKKVWIETKNDSFLFKISEFKPDTIILDPYKWILWKYVKDTIHQIARDIGKIQLGQVPFYKDLSISYILNKKSSVQIQIFSSSGRLIKNIVNDTQHKGSYKYYWTGKDLYGNYVGSGNYFIYFKINNEKRVRKIVKF